MGKDTFSRKLGARGSGICATNLAEMAVKFALRSATQCATELRLETLLDTEPVPSTEAKLLVFKICYQNLPNSAVPDLDPES